MQKTPTLLLNQVRARGRLEVKGSSIQGRVEVQSGK
jgi:hypothetical protein